MRLYGLITCFLTASLYGETLALYLTWYSDPTTTIAIHWHTPLTETEDSIFLAKPKDQWEELHGSYIELGPRCVHTVLLDGLTPDTDYTFRVPSDPTLYKFRTAPVSLNQPLRFVIGGDAYHSTSLFRKMNQAIVSKNPLFAVIGGDIAYAISSNPFRLRSTARNQWFSFLREWKKQMVLPDGRIIPFVLVAGNHDINANEAELFFNLFPFPEKRLYRTMDFSNYLSLILLDTGHLDPIEGDQTAWLAQILSQTAHIPYRIPVYHIGAYPSYYAYSGPIPQKIRANWCPLFDQYNIACAFENHNHAFKRTYPIRNEQIDPAGVIYFGDGCWGASPRPAGDRWYIEKRGQKNNVYLLEITPQSAKIEAIGLGGESLDSVEIHSVTTQ